MLTYADWLLCVWQREAQQKLMEEMGVDVDDEGGGAGGEGGQGAAGEGGEGLEGLQGGESACKADEGGEEYLLSQVARSS